MIYLVDTRRLELLLELSRLGSMREVGEAMQVTTSTVSQQIAALAREAGTPLIEPDGRRVRLTPAGRRLAGHAVTILAAVEAARRDLDPERPAGRNGPGGRLRLGVPPGPAAGGPDAGRAAAGGPAAPARAGTGRGSRPARGGRGRPRADLRLQPRAGQVRPRPAGRAAGQHSVAPGHAVRPGPARNRGGGLPPVPGRRVDRQLTQHRRRGRGAHRGLAGRLRAADHAARGQPRPGARHDPGGPGGRAAPGRAAVRSAG